MEAMHGKVHLAHINSSAVHYIHHLSLVRYESTRTSNGAYMLYIAFFPAVLVYDSEISNVSFK